jgi:hypothetical protein
MQSPRLEPPSLKIRERLFETSVGARVRLREDAQTARQVFDPGSTRIRSNTGTCHVFPPSRVAITICNEAGGRESSDLRFCPRGLEQFRMWNYSV